MKRTLRSRWKALLARGLVCSALVQTGCSHTEQGVVGGGLLGAGIGALAGGPRHAGKGAAIGGLAGAGIGALAGASADRAERRADAQAAAMRQPALSVQDVINLTASGMSDDVIVSQIRASGAVYHLTAQDLMTLNNGGVRPPVIREMQSTVHRPVRRVYTAVPVAQPVYVVEPVPPPPPPVGLGVGVTYIRR